VRADVVVLAAIIAEPQSWRHRRAPAGRHRRDHITRRNGMLASILKRLRACEPRWPMAWPASRRERPEFPPIRSNRQRTAGACVHCGTGLRAGAGAGRGGGSAFL
jgi:hypothetical protein